MAVLVCGTYKTYTLYLRSPKVFAIPLPRKLGLFAAYCSPKFPPGRGEKHNQSTFSETSRGGGYQTPPRETTSNSNLLTQGPLVEFLWQLAKLESSDRLISADNLTAGFYWTIQ